MMEQKKVDEVRLVAAKSRSFWVSQCFLASITTGDSTLMEPAEASEQELCDKIDKMIEAAPNMESIIAVLALYARLACIDARCFRYI